MAYDPFHDLARLFLRFPGIGRRQARRFVYHLLESPEAEVKTLVEEISRLRRAVSQCRSCFRFFLEPNKQKTECPLCQSQTRDRHLLLIVEKDADLDNLEKLGSFSGRYFVLGGLLASLPPEQDDGLRFKELVAKLKAEPEIKEVIIALSANQEGDATLARLEDLLLPFHDRLKITRLGRGLSYGSEIEYVDPETLKNALANRKDVLG